MKLEIAEILGSEHWSRPKCDKYNYFNAFLFF